MYDSAPMNVIETDLPGVLLIEPDVFEDARGYFMETFNSRRFESAGIPGRFVQDNHSRSAHGVLRGLHYQEPRPQGKLVRTVRGEIFDVAVDIRRGSPTFLRWTGAELSDRNRRMLWIPPGFAHGFCVTSDEADVIYKCTELWNGDADRVIRWDDPAIGIDWPIAEPVLSEKDATATLIADAEVLPEWNG